MNTINHTSVDSLVLFRFRDSWSVLSSVVQASDRSRCLQTLCKWSYTVDVYRLQVFDDRINGWMISNSLFCERERLIQFLHTRSCNTDDSLMITTKDRYRFRCTRHCTMPMYDAARLMLYVLRCTSNLLSFECGIVHHLAFFVLFRFVSSVGVSSLSETVSEVSHRYS